MTRFYFMEKENNMDKYYQVGKIVNTQGLRGEVRIVAITDFPEERFHNGQRLYIMTQPQPTPVTVAKSRKQKGMWIVKFKEFDDINQIEPFKGMDLRVAATDQQQLAADEYYYHDIIGMKIIDYNNGEELGVVREILSPGANDVWVVARPGKKDVLLPFIKSVVLKVNVADQQAIVDIPDGLIDDED